MTDKEDEDDEDLRIPVQPNKSLLFVYQSEWHKRLLERFIFFFLIPLLRQMYALIYNDLLFCFVFLLMISA